MRCHVDRRGARATTLPVTLALLAVLVLSAVPAATSAAEIALEKSFWRGWRYSIASGPWQNVGTLGRSLRAELHGDERAQQELDGYAASTIAATISDATSGGLTLAGALLYAEDDTWEASSIALAAGSVVIGALAQYFKSSATTHLLRAVHLHNFGGTGSDLGESRAGGGACPPLPPHGDRGEPAGTGGLGVALALSF